MCEAKCPQNISANYLPDGAGTWSKCNFQHQHYYNTDWQKKCHLSGKRQALCNKGIENNFGKIQHLCVKIVTTTEGLVKVDLEKAQTTHLYQHGELQLKLDFN